MLLASPEDVGVYSGETETNLNYLIWLSAYALLSCECHLLVKDGSEEFETGLDLSLRVACLNDGANDCDIHVLGANVVGGRDHGDVDI
jgi:hypothetical protein